MTLMVCLVSITTLIAQCGLQNEVKQHYIPKPPQNARFRMAGAIQFKARQ